MNWGQLKDNVRSWANRTDLTDSLLGTMLELAEQRIYLGRDGLRLRSMLTTVGALVPGNLPSDLLQIERVSFLTNGRRIVLQSLPTEAFAAYEGQSGMPAFYSVRGSAIFVAPTAASVEFIYYGRPVLMSTVSPDPEVATNPVLDTYPSVYLYAMLAQVGEWLRDAEMVAQYLPMLQAARKDAQDADDDARRGGTPLVITSDQLVRA